MQKIGDFQIVRELGRGGFGILYEAIHQPLRPRVTLRLINRYALEAVSDDGHRAARFIDEVERIAAVSHRSIVRIYDWGQIKDTYYLELEYVEGTSLRTIIDKKQLTIGRCIAILISVARALSYLHSFEIVHRDIRPESILLRRDGRVKIGIPAILDSPGVLCVDGRPIGITDTTPVVKTPAYVVETPAYISPEQVKGKPSPATDVYALGILAFQMITGELPPAAETAPQSPSGQVAESPTRLIDLMSDAPRSLSDLIAKMLEVNPAQRPRAEDVAETLKAIQSEIEDTELPVKGLYAPSISHMKESLQVKATYIMGGKVNQPLPDDELVYIDE